MKWSNKHTLGIGALILMLCIFWAIQKNKKHEKSVSSSNRSIPSVLNEKKQDIIENDAKILAHQESVKKDKEDKILEIQKKLSTPINFYGQVVDELKNPVFEASTRYILINKISWSGSKTLDGPASQQDGKFEITGLQGARLTVYATHPDYHSTELANQSFEYADASINSELASNLPTPDRPAVFVLKKKLKAENIIHHQRIEAKLPLNGSFTSINLRNGSIADGQETIQLALTSRGQEQPLNTNVPYDWNVKIQVPQGGIMERANPLEFLAPSAGFSSQFLIDMPSSTERWDSALSKEFFLKFKTGNMARINLRVGGKGFCVIESFLNPNPSSRNLEYDPNKK